MIHKIKDKEINVIFDGQYYIGIYDCIQIKRLNKCDVIDWFVDKFSK